MASFDFRKKTLKISTQQAPIFTCGVRTESDLLDQRDHDDDNFPFSLLLSGLLLQILIEFQQKHHLDPLLHLIDYLSALRPELNKMDPPLNSIRVLY